jgi:single-strand DNA-binding protein
MPNFSSLTIMGHLGRDCEAKTVGASTVVEFSVAVTRKRKDHESTTWFRCAFWGERAAKVSQWLNKGKAVMVQGELFERTYQKDGQDRKSLEVEVRELVLLGDGRKEHDQHGAEAAPAARQPDPGRYIPPKSDAADEPPF